MTIAWDTSLFYTPNHFRVPMFPYLDLKRDSTDPTNCLRPWQVSLEGPVWGIEIFSLTQMEEICRDEFEIGL